MTGAVTSLVVFTVCPRSMIAHALALHEVLTRHHPEARFHAALSDGDEGLDTTALPFDVVRPPEMGLPDPEAMATRYSDVELRASVKPFVFQLLFDRHPGAGVLYLDPTTFVTSRFDELLDLIAAGADCVLVPAITEPAEHAEISDGHFLRVGAYDPGFVWLADRPVVRRVVWWWARRLETDCLVDPAAGLHLDQRWLDLFPAFIDETRILRHPGYGVAHWNLEQRRLRHAEGRWLVNGLPLRSCHFAVCDLEVESMVPYPGTLSRIGNEGPAADLLRESRATLIGHGHHAAADESLARTVPSEPGPGAPR